MNIISKFIFQLLKWHFSFYIWFTKLLLDKVPVLGRVYKYLGGFVFVVHDWAENWRLKYTFGDKPKVWSELVTDRIDRYLLLRNTDPEKYQWAVKQFNYITKRDPDHFSDRSAKLAMKGVKK